MRSSTFEPHVGAPAPSHILNCRCDVLPGGCARRFGLAVPPACTAPARLMFAAETVSLLGIPAQGSTVSTHERGPSNERTRGTNSQIWQCVVHELPPRKCMSN